jgi:secretion/DNA translocation related TadE-like protein
MTERRRDAGPEVPKGRARRVAEVRARQQGSAAVLLVASAALAGALALGLGRLAAGAVAVARAETAADAAALAAAGELAAGRSGPVAARSAQATAAANGARLIDCHCRGRKAQVTVGVPLPRLPFLPALVTARARAELHPECPG